MTVLSSITIAVVQICEILVFARALDKLVFEFRFARNYRDGSTVGVQYSDLTLGFYVSSQPSVYCC